MPCYQSLLNLDFLEITFSILRDPLIASVSNRLIKKIMGRKPTPTHYNHLASAAISFSSEDFPEVEASAQDATPVSVEPFFPASVPPEDQEKASV